MNNNFYKNLAIWGAMLVAIFLMFNYVNGQKKNETPKNMSFTEFMAAVDNNQITEVSIKGQEVTGKFAGIPKDSLAPKTFTTIIPENTDVVSVLRSHKINIVAKKTIEDSPWYVSLLSALLFPMLFLGVIWYFFLRKGGAGGGGGGAGAMSFGKSKAKVMSGKVKERFKDVAGCEEAKTEVQEIIEFLKNPSSFNSLGGVIPKGCLLVGSPGTGKTLMAKAIAGEAGVPFLNLSGSDFVEMFVGVGAARVRDLFAQGKKCAPCIIFIDEIDAVGRQRGAGLGGGNDEREQTLNALLSEMDGFEGNLGIIVIAATNRPDVLDAALLRPGRFDRQVVLPNPDINGREAIFKVHTGKMPLAKDVDVRILARGTAGFTGASIANMCNEAAILAARLKKTEVDMYCFEKAKERVIMGAEHRSRVMSETEKRTVAYHEAGHAICGAMLPGCDPVHMVSIIPRGMALGVTLSIPEVDKFLYTKESLLDRITMTYGGRAAEKKANGTVTNGASNDIEVGTGLARRMICEFGMSDSLGPVAYGKTSDAVFLGRDFGSQQACGQETAGKIDDEVKKIVTDCLEKAEKILTENLAALHKMAQELIEKETIDGTDVKRIIEECKNS
jgi:cell division protease FtsH